MKYPWQEVALEAFGATPESLSVKINLAQKAIAARQKELPQPDAFERLAIRQALQALAKLIQETRAAAPRQIHFHIRWSGGKLDWERFDSRRGAERAAEQLVRPGETYAIEEQTDDCLTCRDLRKYEKAHTA